MVVFLGEADLKWDKLPGGGFFFSMEKDIPIRWLCNVWLFCGRHVVASWGCARWVRVAWLLHQDAKAQDSRAPAAILPGLMSSHKT